MYAFAQRSDCQVLDEPLYAHFLRLTGAERPYTDLVMASQDAEGSRVVAQQLLGPRDKPLLYAKHMAKHRIGVDRSLLRRARHVLLVREPAAVIGSFAEVLEPTLTETCYPALLELYSELRALGRPPPVVLSDDLVRDPEGTLRALCAALGIDFQPQMLSWPAGPKPYDGVWAPFWYAGTHKSTGFAAALQQLTSRKERPLPEHLQPLLEECRPLYALLRRHALRPLRSAVPRLLGGAGGDEQQQQQQREAQQGQQDNNSSGDASEASNGSSQNTAAPQAMQCGSLAYLEDPRNEDVLVGMRDGVTGRFELVWRPEAKVSVFDSGFMLGDGVWEGIRLHRGVLLFLQDHLDRLYEGAKAIDMDIGLTKQQLAELVYQTIDANGMRDGVHVRLMVSRGLKPTPHQNPAITIGQPTIAIVALHKEVPPQHNERGIKLFTTHVRRGPPDVQDPAWNSHSKLNCISACIQALKVGADEALMLDPQGFVATCNSTNFFCVRKGEVWVPSPKHQMNGITRQNVLALCRREGIPCRELDFSLTQVYSADEAFVTGTFSGQIPVREVDGRTIGSGRRGPLVERLQRLYATLCDEQAAHGRAPAAD
ncbi:branched chain amino acid aminotransferase [Chlorella sorokiniana]|uniref:Branched chain amino acid aminotransferase n=1 Tax=Chlorella sorokiniana TaxID=3076 RepID=A0A2P6TG63_CHLSO|nr:branched chain amino acid aminotransferase [Chlorella sorokiniana]|eukprot:PRW33103.1 branched chain amino acid aminotransferase [Chlorella sorokiniana]